MSKKSFILMALVVNLTICLTLCIVLFTDNDKTNTNNKTKAESSMSQEIKKDETPIDNETTSDYNMDSENIMEETSVTKETSTKVIESQVSTETQPYIYNKPSGAATSGESSSNQETTTPQQAAGNTVNGTIAVISSSCNVRLSADVGANVVGTAKAGTTYTIAPDKCNSNWIAIYLDANTIGYISSSYCTIQ